MGRVLLALVAVAALAGCSTSPKPAPPNVTSTPSVSVTPSPSPSPSPVLPAAARQPTPAGAEAFVRHFFALYNYAFWVRDPAPLQDISHPQCTFCLSGIDAVRQLKSRGSHATGGGIRVTALAVAPGEVVKGLLVNLIINQDSGEALDSKNAVIGATPALSGRRVDVVVRWVDGHWILLDARIHKAGEP